jgi:hypothetical protein
MFARGKSSTVTPFRRTLAAVCAVAILAGQLLAVGHYHQAGPTGRADTATEIAANAGLCEICLLAFHSSAVPGAALAIPNLRFELRFVARSARPALRPFDPAGAPTRAPPAFA